MIPEALPGKSSPLGATVYPEGVNFCVFSKNASKVELLLFAQPLDPQPKHAIELKPQIHRTSNFWHVFIKEIGAGQIYAYRVYGENNPKEGLRFDGQKVILDPYAKAIVGQEIYDRAAAIFPGDNCARSLRAVVIDSSDYDWEDDQPISRDYTRTIIYELHVGGLTRHPSSELPNDIKGTYAGVIAKIPYFKQLGITAVELLPIHEFDSQDVNPGLTNYWGYSTIGFFAPHRAYSSRKDSCGAINEFRDMVKALHKAGIEVILDVVFNHTAEGNQRGPTLAWRGFANEIYYILEDEDKSLYKNYSGCGNTLKTNHPVVGTMILDSLRYWASQMHVDGFRFDLASVMSRDVLGKPVERPAVLWVAESDAVLAGTKLIAEAWDAAGLYQLGWFVNLGERFAEWNGRFRDDVRRFLKGEPNMVGLLAARILGSPDIYNVPVTYRSINFITCHDGFTLNDLVSYNEKHNQSNGENNLDGNDQNFSWNCGQEGPTDSKEIEDLRLRQIKNFLTILFISQGTPMLMMGDDIRRTQQGNNNAYCQDNELSWFDWSGLDRQWDLWCFIRKLINFTQSLKIFSHHHLLSVTYASHQPHLVWHGVKLGYPDWSVNSRSLAFSLRHPSAGEHLHIMLNAYWEDLSFELPLLGKSENWYSIIDTSLPLNQIACNLEEANLVETEYYLVEKRSCVVLMSKANHREQPNPIQ